MARNAGEVKIGGKYIIIALFYEKVINVQKISTPL